MSANKTTPTLNSYWRDVECPICRAGFKKRSCHIRKHPKSFCSRSCYWVSLAGQVQSGFTRLRRSASLSGPNAPTWKGGSSRNYKRGYRSEHYKQWRKSVFERDNYTCRHCGIRGGYLTSHHVKGFAAFPTLRYEVSNGLTLCEPCHSKTDNYKGRAKRRKYGLD